MDIFSLNFINIRFLVLHPWVCVFCMGMAKKKIQISVFFFQYFFLYFFYFFYKILSANIYIYIRFLKKKKSQKNDFFWKYFLQKIYKKYKEKKNILHIFFFELFFLLNFFSLSIYLSLSLYIYIYIYIYLSKKSIFFVFT